jgi:hypothetical protein
MSFVWLCPQTDEWVSGGIRIGRNINYFRVLQLFVLTSK